MHEYKYFKLTKRKSGVLEVLLNRPEKRNAWNQPMHQEWDHILDVAEDDPEVRVLSVRGAGPVFSAGGDLKAGAEGYIKDGVSSSIPRHQIPALPRAWHFRKAIVAGVHGYSGPGANEFLGSCDFVIAAKGTRFSWEVTRMGGEGTTSTMVCMMLPMRVMKKLFMMGGWFDADQALEWQFVQRVVELDDLETETNRWAEELAKMPPEQIKAAKDTLHRIYELMGLVNIMSVGNRGSGHGSSDDREFYKMVQEKGMKEALRFRDAKFDLSLAKV